MSSLCGQGPVIKIYPYRGYTDRWIQRDRQTGKGGEISIQHVKVTQHFSDSGNTKIKVKYSKAKQKE